jgi:hypothetical protein
VITRVGFLGHSPISANLGSDFVANGHEMRRETHLSRRDAFVPAHPLPASTKSELKLTLMGLRPSAVNLTLYSSSEPRLLFSARPKTVRLLYESRTYCTSYPEARL